MKNLIKYSLVSLIVILYLLNTKIIENYDEITGGDNPDIHISACLPKSSTSVSSVRESCTRLTTQESCTIDSECHWVIRSSSSTGGATSHSSGSDDSSEHTTTHSGTKGGIMSSSSGIGSGEDNTDLVIGISLSLLAIGIIIFLVVQYS
jgi:hypothetical protein